MTPPQPDGAPPEKWERRKDDRGHLALVAGLDQLTKEVHELDVQVTASEESRSKELEHFVSYKAFLLMLAGLLSLNLVAMGWFGAQVEKVATSMRSENAEARREQSAWRDAWDKRLEWVLSKIDGSSHFAEPKTEPKRRKER
jgi:hypothetical protein